MNCIRTKFIKSIKFPVKRLHTLTMNENEIDKFRESFRYFKRNKKPEDLFDVIDFESKNLSQLVVPNFPKTELHDSCVSCSELGLLPHDKWQIYSLKGLSGFSFIKNPFPPAGQQYWIQKCLALYARKPSITNLDRHHKSIDDVWSLQQDNDPTKQKLIDKLTSATLGYHYNWETKGYDRAHCSPFPDCLAHLSKHISSCLSFKSFKPEAAIVNYYNTKSTLGIHSDQFEDDLEKPLLSISFGQSAILLMGSEVRTEKPLPMFVRSGDIVILSGSCRTYYHAVPSIIQDDVQKRYCVSDSDKSWQPFEQYIQKHRINVSVRQVYENNEAGLE